MLLNNASELFIDVLCMFYAGKFAHDLHLPTLATTFAPYIYSYRLTHSPPPFLLTVWQLNLMNLKTKTETQRGKLFEFRSLSLSEHMLRKSIELWVGQGQGQGQGVCEGG